MFTVNGAILSIQASEVCLFAGRVNLVPFRSAVPEKEQPPSDKASMRLPQRLTETAAGVYTYIHAVKKYLYLAVA